jgi:hypothetical protein
MQFFSSVKLELPPASGIALFLQIIRINRKKAPFFLNGFLQENFIRPSFVKPLVVCLPGPPPFPCAKPLKNALFPAFLIILLPNYLIT